MNGLGLEPLDVHNESDVAVAQNGSAGDAVDTLEILFEAFDHDLLLADQGYNRQAPNLLLAPGNEA